jgi:hypothetical protein
MVRAAGRLLDGGALRVYSGPVPRRLTDALDQARNREVIMCRFPQPAFPFAEAGQMRAILLGELARMSPPSFFRCYGADGTCYLQGPVGQTAGSAPVVLDLSDPAVKVGTTLGMVFQLSV